MSVNNNIVQSLSARNQIPGRVRHIRKGTVMAEVLVDCGGQEVVAAITRDSVERLQLEEGTEVRAIIKATEVIIAR